jgi:putative endopeptidase
MMPSPTRPLLACVCLAVSAMLTPPGQAQSSSPAPAGASISEKKISLLPGLDKELMDTSNDPCVDFAKYSCGNFSKLYPIPPDRSSYGSDIIVDEYTESVLHALLDRFAAKSAQQTANEQKIGDYYATCMAVNAIDAEGLKPLELELDRIAALASKKELTDLLAHDQMINVNAFFGYGAQQDFKNAEKQIAVVDQGGLGLPERDYYFRAGEKAEKTRQDYVAHVATMLRLMGEPADRASADAAKIMTLETALAKVSMDVTARRDPDNIYHPMTLAKLSELAPEIDWPKLFAHTGAPAISELNVANPDFFKGLQSAFESTDLETIKAYLRWQLINSVPADVLPRALDEEEFDFRLHKLRGQPEQEPRWKRCVNSTDHALGEALGQVYVAENFPASSKAYTVRMVHDIEDAMAKEIDTQWWMSDETKAKAKAKLRLVAGKIGYPDHWRDYSSLVVVRG